MSVYHDVWVLSPAVARKVVAQFGGWPPIHLTVRRVIVAEIDADTIVRARIDGPTITRIEEA